MEVELIKLFYLYFRVEKLLKLNYLCRLGFKSNSYYILKYISKLFKDFKF